MEPEKKTNLQPSEEKMPRVRHRNKTAYQKRRRDRKPQGKKSCKEISETLDSSCFAESNASLSTWRDYFSNHKALLMVMDYHSLMITKNQGENVIKCLNCNRCLISLEEVGAHILEPRHLSLVQANWSNYTIKRLFPTPKILEKIDVSLETEVTKSGCTREILTLRQKAFEAISTRIKEAWPDVAVHMVGSSYHGLGLINCDLNISLSCDEDSPVVVPLSKMSKNFESHMEEFQAIGWHLNELKKPPRVCFKWKGEIPCSLLILDSHSHKLAKLIREYGSIDERCRKLCVLLRKWAFVCKVDGSSEGYWPSHAIYLMVIYFLQQLPNPVLPVLHELIPMANDRSEVYENMSELINARWVTKNTSNLATLWIQMLKFYCYGFDSVNHVICITQLSPLRRNNCITTRSRIAIVDPYDPEKNVNRTVSNSTGYDFIIHCLRSTCAYFCIPQCEEGPLFGSIRPPPINDLRLNTPGYKEFLDVQQRLTHYIVRLIPHTDSNYHNNPTEKGTILEKIAAIKGPYVNICSMNMDHFNNLKKCRKPLPNQYAGYTLFFEDATYLASTVRVNKLHYGFSNKVFTQGREHPQCCMVCSMNGHNQNSCPEMKLGNLETLPKIDPALIKIIDGLCYDVFNMSMPTEVDLSKKDGTLSFLQEYVEALYPNACLTLFGSSKNGFGLKKSDMDICLTFKDCPNSADVPAGALSDLLKHMKKSKDLRKLVYIENAKVPIVKFLHTPSMLEGDISLYNTLAQENTKMLWTYSEIDIRVKILGYVVKHFAKVCSIGDASKGSLSSYCYILMMIYFLQRCSPPVIPVLQTLPKTSKCLPKTIVDACNTYFFNDIDKLEEVWPGYKKNDKTPGELWIEFLRFYTEEFDSENYVISIRSDEPVMKLEKRWFTKTLAIEDPFNHQHNLGSGLTRRMNHFIIKVFRNARTLFTSKLKTNGKKSLTDSYFNNDMLVKMEPPNDRGCNICRCIGHVASQCPDRRNKGGNIKNNTKNDQERKKTRAPIERNEKFSEGNRLLFTASSKPKPHPGTSQSSFPAQVPQNNTQRSQQDSYQQVMHTLIQNAAKLKKKPDSILM